MENEMATPSETNVPAPDPIVADKKFSFHGDGRELFSIYIVNILLSIVSLGLYYPWAKAALIKYNYGETEFLGSRFTFHGTGKEMFVGFIKALLVLGSVFGLYALLTYYGYFVVAFFIYLGSFAFLTPLAIVGVLKYRTSRSSWRGIHFGYRGTYTSMLKIFLKGILFSVLSLGFYGPWFVVDVYKEIFSNIRMGNMRFTFTGDGGSYFGINLGGYLATIFTLGIYFFKWRSNLHNFTINNIRLIQVETKTKGTLKASTTGRGYLKLMVVNFIILLFSLGLATPWIIVRTMRFYMDNTVVVGAINFDTIIQTESYTPGAMGEGLADSMDLGF